MQNLSVGIKCMIIFGTIMCQDLIYLDYHPTPAAASKWQKLYIPRPKERLKFSISLTQGFLYHSIDFQPSQWRKSQEGNALDTLNPNVTTNRLQNPSAEIDCKQVLHIFS